MSELETTLVLSIGQIIEGDAECVWKEDHEAPCVRPAVLTISTGADPDPEPTCALHAAQWLTDTERLLRAIWTPQFPAASVK